MKGKDKVYRKRTQGWLKHTDFMMLDLLCLHVAFLLAYMVRHGLSNPYGDRIYTGLLLCLTLANVVTAIMLNTYKNVLKRGYYIEFVKTIRQDAVVTLIAMCYLFLIQEGLYVSRFVIGFMGVLYLGISYVTRMLWKTYLRRKMAGGKGRRSLLLITTGEQAEELIGRFQTNNYGMFYLSGLVLVDGTGSEQSIAGVPVVADVERAAEYACREWVDEVLVSIPRLADYPEKLISDFMEMGVVVHLGMPDTFNPYGQRQVMERLSGMNVLTSSIRFTDSNQLLMKRLMDIIVGAVGSIVTVLMTLVLGPLIFFHSPGPIFFKQTRVGRNGRQFQMYKFRSMYLDAEARKAELMRQNNIADGMMFKMDNDPRIIGSKILPDGTVKKGFGNFIRDWSLDEFPQFFNVLKGEMSVVGTRPPTLDEWEKYELHHRRRLAIKPGITGLWQVSGRSNITDFEEVVKLDAKYIADWDVGKDIVIVMKTVRTVVKREGAK